MGRGLWGLSGLSGIVDAGRFRVFGVVDDVVLVVVVVLVSVA